jgi:glycosyltransferase involved in cell wall biosynthesis
MICDQIRASARLRAQVEVLVSDNASTDDTQRVLRSFDPGGVRFQHIRQPTNTGLDGNMRSLYRICDSDYIWYFSDDDILFDGAIDKVLAALEDERPEALLFSFVQPPGSTTRTFDFPEERAIVRDPARMIQLLAFSPKLSHYVLKRIDLSPTDEEELAPFMGTDFDFIAVSYSVLKQAGQATLCVIPEPLAGCDPEFNRVRFSPDTWGRAWVVYTHPYVTTYAPYLLNKARKAAYYDHIAALWAVQIGVLQVENRADYDHAASKLKVRLPWLVIRPKLLLKLFLMKSGLTGQIGRPRRLVDRNSV